MGFPRREHDDADPRARPCRWAFNRQPHYARGLLLVGDAGGMVNPFNGEGIAYAMESAEIAATAMAEAHYRGVGTPSAEKALGVLPGHAQGGAGRLLHLGRVFVKLIGNPQVMRVCTKYGLPRKTLMRFTLKLLANLTDSRGRRRHGQTDQLAVQDRTRSMTTRHQPTAADRKDGAPYIPILGL